jgi:DNA replication protein
MRSNNYSAIDFSYLLLDFYKEMNMNENELAVILMIYHLHEQGNEFVTPEALALKMSLTPTLIDKSLTSLYKKKYIEFDTSSGEPRTTLEPIKKILYKKFEKSLFTEEEYNRNEELSKIRQDTFELFEKYFKRKLTPIELSHIDDYFKNDVDQEIIINSLKDAANVNKLTISYIDSLIIKRLENDQ